MESCPICGATSFSDFSGRPAAHCLQCGSLERHRTLVKVFASLPESALPGHCLEVAPLNPFVYGGYLRQRGWRYTCTDKWKNGNPDDPRAVGFIDYEADLVDLFMFRNGQFDLVVLQHVIEEIENYPQALAEIARVMSPKGVALLEIPYDRNTPCTVKAGPNHFGNLWRFGADLIGDIRKHLPRVDVMPMRQGTYSSDLFVCRHEASEKRSDVYMAHGHDANFAGDLRTLLTAMRGRGCRCLKPDEFLAGEEGFLLTIDDGHPNDLTVAYPILQEFDGYAVNFLIPLHADNTPRVTDWAAWRAVASRIEVGAHSLSHTKVGTRPAGQQAAGQTNVAAYFGMPVYDPQPALAAFEYNPINNTVESPAEHQARIIAEVALPKRILEQMLGRPVRFFSYPWGEFGDDAVAAVRNAGYTAAFSVTSTDSSRWTIPRINLPPFAEELRLERPLIATGADMAKTAAQPAPSGFVASEIPIPPDRLRFMAETPDEYRQTGDEIVENLRQLAALRDDAHVVDIGCGYGRLAHAFLRDISFNGTYTGVDILAPHICWCQQVLTPLSSGRFAFHVLDVQSDRYNPDGTIAAAEANLGVADNCGDVIVLTSVFTHMYPEQIRHYLGEIKRILADEGQAFITFFLLDDACRDAAKRGETHYPIPHELTDYCRYMDPDNPLHVIAFETEWVMDETARAGLRLVQPIRRGTWRRSCGGEDFSGSFQDVVMLGHA